MIATASENLRKVGEADGGGEVVARDPGQFQRGCGDDAQGPLGADEQPCQIETGGGLGRLAAGVDDLSLGQHHRQTRIT